MTLSLGFFLFLSSSACIYSNPGISDLCHYVIQRFYSILLLPVTMLMPTGTSIEVLTFTLLKPHRKALPADSSGGVEILQWSGTGLQRWSISLTSCVRIWCPPVWSYFELFLNSASLHRNCHYCSGNEKYAPLSRGWKSGLVGGRVRRINASDTSQCALGCICSLCPLAGYFDNW